MFSFFILGLGSLQCFLFKLVLMIQKQIRVSCHSVVSAVLIMQCLCLSEVCSLRVLIDFDCTWPTAIGRMAREVCTCAAVRGSGLAAQEVSMVHEVLPLLALEDGAPAEVGDQKTKTNVMDKVTSRMIRVLNLQRRIGVN